MLLLDVDPADQLDYFLLHVNPQPLLALARTQQLGVAG